MAFVFSSVSLVNSSDCDTEKEDKVYTASQSLRAYLHFQEVFVVVFITFVVSVADRIGHTEHVR